MAHELMASRLLNSEVGVREQIYARIKHLMEGVDMALYDRSSGFGFVYSNLGDLVKKMQAMGASTKPNFLNMAMDRKRKSNQDSLEQLKDNVNRLEDMHLRLQFMLSELEGLVRKG